MAYGGEKGLSSYHSANHGKKASGIYTRHTKYASCPYQRRLCFTDSTVCGDIGYYAECPLKLNEKIYAEIKEGGYQGIDPYHLFRAVRKGVRP